VADGELLITAGFAESPEAGRSWAVLDPAERVWLCSYVGQALTAYGRRKRAGEVLKQLRGGPEAVRIYFGPVDYHNGMWSGGAGMT
jgi:hypothetical protein